jgi:hypothetical protein
VTLAGNAFGLSKTLRYAARYGPPDAATRLGSCNQIDAAGAGDARPAQ